MNQCICKEAREGGVCYKSYPVNKSLPISNSDSDLVEEI